MALTVWIVFFQLSLVDLLIVEQKVMPKIFTSEWKTIPKIEAGTDQLAMARALDLLGLSIAPDAFS
jgi:hypothetical protein